jgi:hypothetical protein
MSNRRCGASLLFAVIISLAIWVGLNEGLMTLVGAI